MGYISLENVLALAATFVTLGLLRIFIDYRLALSAIKYVSCYLSDKHVLKMWASSHPGYTLLLRHGGILASIIPRRIWGISLGRGFAIKRKHERSFRFVLAGIYDGRSLMMFFLSFDIAFQELGWDIICMVNFEKNILSSHYNSDPHVILFFTTKINLFPYVTTQLMLADPAAIKVLLSRSRPSSVDHFAGSHVVTEHMA